MAVATGSMLMYDEILETLGQVYLGFSFTKSKRGEVCQVFPLSNSLQWIGTITRKFCPSQLGNLVVSEIYI